MIFISVTVFSMSQRTRREKTARVSSAVWKSADSCAFINFGILKLARGDVIIVPVYKQAQTDILKGTVAYVRIYCLCYYEILWTHVYVYIMYMFGLVWYSLTAGIVSGSRRIPVLYNFYRANYSASRAQTGIFNMKIHKYPHHEFLKSHNISDAVGIAISCNFVNSLSRL